MRIRTVLTIIGLLALGAVPAGGEGSLSAAATVQGATATVTGVASIPAPEGPLDIGGALTDFAGAATPAGPMVQLTDAEIELLDDGLRFIWHVTDLPDVVPPEGVRYTWSFAAGDQTFQLQAKSSNLASVTTSEDPVGHVQQTGQDWFQLRGACEAEYQGAPLAGCYHLAFLDGAFDPAADTVTIDMPFGTTDRIGRLVGDTFRPGVEITAIETAGASITGSFQAVASTTALGSFINGWQSVFTGPIVQLGVGRPGINPGSANYSTTATFDPETGEFSGTVSGLTSTMSAVYARACHGVKSACVAIEVAQG